MAGNTSITCSKIENSPYNIIFATKFNNPLILIKIISCDYICIWICRWRMNMLVTSQYQPRLSSIINFYPGGSVNRTAIYISNYIIMKQKVELSLWWRAYVRVKIMVLNVTFNNISAISWWSALLVETGKPEENHRPVASHWQTLSNNVVHLALIEIRTHNINDDRHWLHS